MSQNQFQVNGRFYEQKESTAMDNSLFLFIANVLNDTWHNELPVLDIAVIRNVQSKLEINIHRKGTHTNTFIPVTSNDCNQHRMSAINFLVNSLVRFPLNKRII